MKLAVLAGALALAASGAAAAYDKPRWKDPTQPDLFPKNFGYKDPHPPLFPKNYGYKPPKEERSRAQKIPSFAPDFGPDRVYTQRNRRGQETSGGGKPFDIVR